MSRHGVQDLQDLVRQALMGAGASAQQADSTARALVVAQAQGLASHGLSRVPMYAAHIAAGRVDGRAVPKVVNGSKGGAALIDAGDGFAFAACELAVAELLRRAPECGIAISAVTNSHHFGAAAYHLAPLAKAGLVGLAFGNSPAAMPAAGGRHAVFGTNPIAAAFPRNGHDPVTVDLSLSEVARGKLMVAASKGESIPLGWALDAEGRATTDPAQGLKGSMLPFGGVKGAMLALVVELMVTTLTGAQYGAEADSFFVTQGNKPKLGQVFIAIDPRSLGGDKVYQRRLESLLGCMLRDENVRIPGYRRFELEARALLDGIEIEDALFTSLHELAVRV